MSYSVKTASIIAYLIPSIDFSAIDITSRTGVVMIDRWDLDLPQPSEQEIIDAEASQAYIDWRAENGGDPVKTLRRQAQEALSESKAESALLRAALLTIVDEFNNHADKTNAILDAIDGASSLATLKSSIGAISNLPQRTGAQLRTAAENKLTSGDADS